MPPALLLCGPGQIAAAVEENHTSKDLHAFLCRSPKDGGLFNCLMQKVTACQPGANVH